MKLRTKVIPVAQLDRLGKARMIERVLQDFRGTAIENLRILDIGCGNGDIGNYFARRNDQYGVDVSDRRRNKSSNFRFQIVGSEWLPFAGTFFDIVISHHVIEHVVDQSLHLSEIYRVMRPEGCAYLATPNRNSPLMKGHIGNEKVLRYPNMLHFFKTHNFKIEEYTTSMLKEPGRFELDFKGGQLVPRRILRALGRFIPTHVFVLQREPKM